MHYALQHHGIRARNENATETTQKPMGSSAHSALSGAVLSADLCPLRACSVGLSLFLLVSVFLGDRDVGIVGSRLPQTKELVLKRGLADRDNAALPPGREETTRRQHSGRVALQVGFSLRIVGREFGSKGLLTAWP
jgi:hypothetical protein